MKVKNYRQLPNNSHRRHVHVFHYAIDHDYWSEFGQKYKDIEQWCIEVFNDDFYLSCVMMYCANKNDMILFKLTWC
jgi:hypothetical protein